MLQVAIAGGSGNVAQEVIDAIIARGTYEVIVLSRSDAPSGLPKSLQWRKVNYDSQESLVNALNGIDTLLSFIHSADMATTIELQKILIQAAIKAGVRRFAPSEWATKSESGVTYYLYKDEIHKHLEQINSEKKQIEYCLFQPGFFMNYFAAPRSTPKQWQNANMFADFEHRRAIIPDGPDYPLTLTTIEDMCQVVALALEFPGQWPTTGGIQGTQTTLSKFLQLAEQIRGPFKIERLPLQDVVKGEINASWYPVLNYTQIPDEYREGISKNVLKEYLQALAHGAWSVSDEWNKLLPNFKFTKAEDYLTKSWKTTV